MTVKAEQDAADTSVDASVDTSTDSLEEAMDDGTSFETEDDNQAETSDVADESEDTSDFDETDDNVADKTDEESVDEEAEAEDTAAKDEKPKKGEADPDKARNAFKERELRRQIQKEEREKQEKITLDRYLKEANDDEDELARRQLQVESYNINKERAALNEEKIISGITKAKADIPLLSSTDPTVQEEIGNAVDDFEAMYVVKNEYGDVVEVKADVYQYLQRKADSISKLTGIGARQESQNKEKQKSRTMTAPSAKPKTGKSDPEMDAFDEEAKRY